MINSIGSVAVTVKNGKKALEWYTSKLGWRAYSTEGHWITVGPKGSDFVIHLCETDELEPGNTSIVLRTKDIDSEYNRLTKLGVRFPKPVAKAAWGTFAVMVDPDGNEYQLEPSE
jgi:predicted enzyme related to lactoylglutathione lyase